MNKEIRNILCEQGADLVRFVDISGLSSEQTQGFSRAIVFCIALSKAFILAIHDGGHIDRDEFVETEHRTDQIADWLAAYIRQKGYHAYAQSEQNNEKCGSFDEKTMSSRLPHKTVAKCAGLGYIGKNNLLITEAYGCAFSMCTVLTDAPVTTEKHPPVASKCGPCEICKAVCADHAIYGNEWTEDGNRNAVMDVFKCNCPLKCMVQCPHTLNYAMRSE